MMARLIDAKQLEKQVKQAFGTLNPVLMGQMLRWIRKQQTVDAVPVVRCGQCKFDNLCCRNVGKDGKRTKDDFCSYGEWKEGAENG